MNADEARKVAAKGRAEAIERAAREKEAAEKRAAERAAAEKDRIAAHNAERAIYISNAIGYCAKRGDTVAEVDKHHDDDSETLLAALRNQGYDAHLGTRYYEVDERDHEGGFIRTDVRSKPAYIIKW